VFNKSITEEILTVLIKAGEDVLQVDNKSRNVLWMVCKNNISSKQTPLLAIVKLLVRSACIQNQTLMVNQLDRVEGMNPLMCYLTNDNIDTDIVRYLIYVGTLLSQTNK